MDPFHQKKRIADVNLRKGEAAVFEPVMQATADIVKAAAADTSLASGGVAKLGNQEGHDIYGHLKQCAPCVHFIPGFHYRIC
eukprot:41161-Pelagomonas_calceolata.AAC.1